MAKDLIKFNSLPPLKALTITFNHSTYKPVVRNPGLDSDVQTLINRISFLIEEAKKKAIKLSTDFIKAHL